MSYPHVAHSLECCSVVIVEELTTLQKQYCQCLKYELCFLCWLVFMRGFVGLASEMDNYHPFSLIS
jgi:hypothetical protein